MKIETMLFLISFCFLSLNENYAKAQSDNVDKLITVIKKNTDDYVRISEKTLDDLSAVLEIEKKITSHINEITALLGQWVQTPTENLVKSMKQLQILSDEKVYVENMLEGLSVILPKIEVCIKKIDELFIPYPEARATKKQKKAMIFKKLTDLELSFKERKTNVDEHLKKWGEWQMKIAKAAQSQSQYEVMDRLEVIQSLDKINETFTLMNVNFYLSIKNHEYEDAENILQGYSWLRSAFPFYFSDKITTSVQYQLLNQIKDDAEYQQHEMTNFLTTHPSKLRD